MDETGWPPDPFQNEVAELSDPSAFGQMVLAVRDVQDLVAGTNPPTDVLQRVRSNLEEISGLLRPYRCDEAEAPAGKVFDLPGRGHPLLIPFVIDEQTPERLCGRAWFSRFHLGGNGAAHGGTLPLLFDEVLGRFANNGRPISRTAYLNVNYRRITPIGPALDVEATFDREEGRKRYVTGRLLHDGNVVADAEGLFVQLRPGQP